MNSPIREWATLALRHLLTRGLVSPEECAPSNLIFSFKPSRNTVFLIEDTNRTLLYKEVKPSAAGTYEWATKEAGFYKAVSVDDTLAALKSFIPRFIDYDPHSGRLITEAIFPGRTALMQAQAPDADIAALLRGIAYNLHLLHTIRLAGEIYPCFEKVDLPLLFNFFETSGRNIRPRTNQAQCLLQALEQNKVFTELVRELHESWTSAVLIHSDLRLANIVLSDKTGNIYFVDWEAHGWGDQDWDLGALLGSLIYLLLISGKSGTKTAVENGIIALEQILGSYCEDRSNERILKFACIAVIQYMLEDAQVTNLEYPFEPLLSVALSIPSSVTRLPD